MENINVLGLAKLLLEIQAPNLEDCWSQGYEMANQVDVSANPYAKGTSMHRHWSNGWWSAYQESDTTQIKPQKTTKLYNYKVTNTLIKESLYKAANNSIMHESAFSKEAKNS